MYGDSLGGGHPRFEPQLRQVIFLFPEPVQMACGPHPSSPTMGTRPIDHR